MRSGLGTVLASWVVLGTGALASAQISLTTAVDLALRSNPKVQLAETDVHKAQGAVMEAKDAYVPNLTAGSGLGYSYGYPLGQPSVVNVQSQSVLLSFSQRNYVRAARASLDAANLTLRDAREGVEEDTVVTYIALDRDSEREQALADELKYADSLVNIVADRLNAGQDTALNLTEAKLTAAQIRLAKLHAEDETSIDRAKLARLIGLPSQALTTEPGSVPDLDQVQPSRHGVMPDSPAVQAAFANARSKLQQAFGDARKLYRPEVYFASQYSLFAKFNNYQKFFPPGTFQYNNAGVGVQVMWPMFDRSRKARAEESAADAAHAEVQARVARDEQQDGQLRLERSTTELAARAEVAELQQGVAEQQLAVLRIQLQANAANATGPQMTPKDEANAEIGERQKFVDVLNARMDLLQARVNLLRQSGTLEDWLKHAAGTVVPPVAAPATP
jgi:outer membrane protein TolC